MAGKYLWTGHPKAPVQNRTADICRRPLRLRGGNHRRPHGAGNTDPIASAFT